MGDGCLYAKEKPMVVIFTSKDLEYCTYMKEIIKKYVLFLRKTSPSIIHNGAMYFLTIHSKSFCTWMIDITRGKRHVPKEIIKSQNLQCKKEFLRGLMDSEGCIGKTGSNFFNMGFRIKDPWIKEVHTLFKDLNVKVSPSVKKYPITAKRFNGKKFNTHQYGFNINIPSYIEANIGFYLKRKNRRLEEFRKLKMMMTNI